MELSPAVQKLILCVYYRSDFAFKTIRVLPEKDLEVGRDCALLQDGVFSQSSARFCVHLTLTSVRP